MPQVRSHCVCCESAPRFFDSLSVSLMFQKVDMCAPCDAVFTEPPHHASARCTHGTEGPDEITPFTAALSSGWQQRGGGQPVDQFHCGSRSAHRITAFLLLTHPNIVIIIKIP
ncbi:hypothetical protein CesoFtcFv8_004548 [Champsocephalus esox]|uniref:Uncharacterized protein n=2 Tax=Champsocephalus TaxID=52236 RepID=A0AAN8DX07_CHAGU|nr:hypothetical protein CesoFtcFv8_004548 [Champsocephalus esox]KAK5930170.1 hypothetical protein CgunFtcFv8_026431 [Champsocephalus gunnari]